MIYISLKDKIEKNNVIKIIKELKIKGKTYDESLRKDDSLENLKKSKLVICDLNIENIKDYLALKKIVIVFKKNNAKLEEEEANILYDKNVYTYNRKNELREILNFQLKKSKTKKVVIGFLILICLVAIAISTLIFLNLPIKKTSPKKEAKKETEVVEKVDYRYENIVFYGDSITDFYDLEKHYKDLPVINSGTSGFQTKDLLRLVEERVYVYNPTKVFIMIGTNDIAFTELTNEEVVNNIKKLVSMIKKNRPKAKIYLESIYPVNRNTEGNDIVSANMVNVRKNERIREINELLKKATEEEKITFIDMYDILSDEKGDLILDYTTDGLHISEKGYDVVTKKIMEYIDPSTKSKEEKVEKK